MFKASGLVFLILFAFALHNDWWNREPQLAPTAGWLPADITYRLWWLVGASFVLWLALRLTWRRAR